MYVVLEEKNGNKFFTKRMKLAIQIHQWGNRNKYKNEIFEISHKSTLRKMYKNISNNHCHSKY